MPAPAPAGAWEDAAREAAVKARRRRTREHRTAWKQSLRRRGVAAFLAAMTFSVGGAVAADRAAAPAAKLVRKGATGPTVVTIQQALGIPADGIFGPQTRRAVKRFQRRNGLAVDGIVGPVTMRALGISAPAARKRAATRAPRRGGSSARILRAIARCESGGNPRAVSPDGRYRGKYQFSRQTWRRLGGKGDPAKAPEAVQDRIAAKLLAQEGTSPWPACSARL